LKKNLKKHKRNRQGHVKKGSQPRKTQRPRGEESPKRPGGGYDTNLTGGAFDAFWGQGKRKDDSGGGTRGEIAWRGGYPGSERLCGAV